ncbi:MAG: SPOR domain-containing protein [Alphaproteobacteria bacterium]|nr:MAG: SPOR domain-containing protein [Alphaproteobacteria bacterium]
MTKHRNFRPLLACVSIVAIGACSHGAPAQTGMQQPATQVDARADAQSNTGLRKVADDLAASGRHQAAIPLYRHIASTSGDPGAMLALAGSLSAQGAHGEAVSVLEILAKRGQLNADGRYLLGKTRLALGDYEGALDAFDGAADQMPMDGRVISGRGIALAALGRTEAAMAAFSNAIDATSLSNMALVTAASGNPDDAIGILEPLVTGGLVSVQGRQNLAMAYLLAGREADARRMARVDLEPQTIDETFTFYRSLASLDPAHRMQALVVGTIDPSWTPAEKANLTVADSVAQQEAAKRVLSHEEPVRIAAAPAPAPVPEPAPAPKDRSNYVLTEVPPLLEPEGWALQIAAYRSLEELMRGWTILYRQSGDLLENVPPRRSEVDFGNTGKKPHGFYYRLNAGPLRTLAEARTLCHQLKERGTDCWIRPPEKSEGKLPGPADVAEANKTTEATVADSRETAPKDN